MIIKDTESVDIHTSTGPRRTYLFPPATEGRYPGLVLELLTRRLNKEYDTPLTV